MKLTEQWILLQAPNASAAQNGKKLSQKGSFLNHYCTADGTLYWADCAGSGMNPYHTSVDLRNPEQPTCRCSCPSRQFPCKHALGLLFEIALEKPFTVSEVPEDLAKKREKQIARAEKKASATAEKKPKKVNAAAQAKKIQKQLDGITLAQQMIQDLLQQGVGTLAGASVKVYEKLAKDLGSYYLTGAQTAFQRLVIEIQKIQKAPEQADYQEAMRILVWLHAMLQKSRTFLEKKLEEKQFAQEDTFLFEALGGIWKLEDLEQAGLMKEAVQLIQLSFDVQYDPAKKEYIDRGYWMELGTGEIHQTRNYRPVKALKYIKAEDSCFDTLRISKLYYYPGTGNRRVRWEGATTEPVTSAQLKEVIGHAIPDFATAIQKVKNEIKNTLSEKYLAVLVAFQKIGMVENTFVVEDHTGARIVLRDRTADGEDHQSVEKLVWLPNHGDREEQYLFGLIFYDTDDRRLCLHPYSIVTETQVIRLQY